MKEMQEALENKRNDVNTFTWKWNKEVVKGVTVNQREQRMMDMTESELRKAYKVCQEMLYNTDPKRLGRYELKKLLPKQRIYCNAELFMRWLQTQKGIARYKFLEALRSFISNNREICIANGVDIMQLPLSNLVGNLPTEFDNITLEVIMDCCLDQLGKFDHSHITLSFILRMGLWFTPQESKDLTEKDENGNIKDRLDVVKQRRGLKKVDQLRITPKGLSYSQFRAMLDLTSKRYADLTSEQLTVLRNRVLFALEEKVDMHIAQWEERKRQIMLVADKLGFTIE